MHENIAKTFRINRLVHVGQELVVLGPRELGQRVNTFKEQYLLE